jgi:hypothetical protein
MSIKKLDAENFAGAIAAPDTNGTDQPPIRAMEC